MADARIIKKGTQTMGKIVDTETLRTTDSYGGVHITHYITYEYTDSDGRKFKKRKKVSDKLSEKARGEEITVYYLPQRPDKSTIK